MNCPYCSKQLGINERFCVNCYRPLPAGSTSSSTMPVSQGPSTLPPTPPPTSNYAQPHWEYSVAEFVLTNDGYYLFNANNIQQEHKIGLAAYSNMVGKEGWELASSIMARRVIPKGRISVSDLIHGGSKDMIDVLTLIFKRPIM